MRLAVAALVLAVLLACAVPAAHAQGCAMCRQSAAAMDAQKQKALDLAILILLLPTVSIFGGVILWAFRKGARGEQENPLTPAPWLASNGGGRARSTREL